MAELNVLSLVEEEVEFSEPARRWLFSRREISRVRTHLEFMVDGVPLREHVRRWNRLNEAPSELSRLTDFDPHAAVEQIDRLRGLTPHQYGARAWLLFCPVCADEGCAGLTTTLAIHGNRVVWSDFGWDTNYEIDDEDPVRIATAPTFTFDRVQYDNVLLEARNEFIRQIQEAK